jgi:hypothetical protein
MGSDFCLKYSRLLTSTARPEDTSAGARSHAIMDCIYDELMTNGDCWRDGRKLQDDRSGARQLFGMNPGAERVTSGVASTFYGCLEASLARDWDEGRLGSAGLVNNFSGRLA